MVDKLLFSHIRSARNFLICDVPWVTKRPGILHLFSSTPLLLPLRTIPEVLSNGSATRQTLWGWINCGDGL